MPDQRPEPRQEVHFVPRERRIPMAKKPSKVWLLVPAQRDPAVTPKLPIEPRHRANAVICEMGHDWRWSAGTFIYSSVVLTDTCWILCEFE